MISLIMKNKKLDFQVNYNFKDLAELKAYIKNIKTYQFNSTEIKVVKTDEVEEFMKRTYVSEFFTIEKDYIFLNVVKNGMRRTLKYKRSTNNNKLLSKTLDKVRAKLDSELSSIDFAFDLNEGDFKKDKQIITIKLEDLRTQNNSGLCVIEFDKDKWTFSFNKLQSSRLEEVYEKIFLSFESITKYTRAYRQKKNATAIN